jgi:hypothetical protein
MLTDYQQHKLECIKGIYFREIDALPDMTDDKFIQILRDNNWHMSKSFEALIYLHREMVAGFKRIEACKHIVRPEDIHPEGCVETWSEAYKCRTCDVYTLNRDHRDKYCSNCGTKVDWSEIK